HPRPRDRGGAGRSGGGDVRGADRRGGHDGGALRASVAPVHPGIVRVGAADLGTGPAPHADRRQRAPAQRLALRVPVPAPLPQGVRQERASTGAAGGRAGPSDALLARGSRLLRLTYPWFRASGRFTGGFRGISSPTETRKKHGRNTPCFRGESAEGLTGLGID